MSVLGGKAVLVDVYISYGDDEPGTKFATLFREEHLEMDLRLLVSELLDKGCTALGDRIFFTQETKTVEQETITKGWRRTKHESVVYTTKTRSWSFEVVGVFKGEGAGVTNWLRSYTTQTATLHKIDGVTVSDSRVDKRW